MVSRAAKSDRRCLVSPELPFLLSVKEVRGKSDSEVAARDQSRVGPTHAALAATLKLVSVLVS